jgi:flagellar secretion chaperone FliS
MARMAAVRAQYAQNLVTTTKERLVTMLYDRLVRDLVAAEQALEARKRELGNAELQHAQAILVELLHSLDREAWSGADGLASLYAWLIEQLLQANVRQDAAQVAACRTLVEGLADAWHQASAEVARPMHLVRPGENSTMGAAV